MRLRKRVYEALSVAAEGGRFSRSVDIFIVSLIGLNVIALTLESIAAIRNVCPYCFTVFEWFSVIFFSVEYCMRVWSCVESEKYRHPVVGRMRFVATPLALVDLLAVLPFYLPMVGLDLRFLRIVRMMRVFRLAKVGRYSGSVQILQHVISARKEQLVSSLFALLLLLIVAASLMYYAENRVQPEVFSSIPVSMWWVVTTLTKVGYADVTPITLAGKLLTSVIGILGIAMFAIPAGILSAGFVEAYDSMQKKRKCPNCGKDFDEGAEAVKERSTHIDV